MKVFELWLDESGQFENDNKSIDNPSLVGGILIEEGKISSEDLYDMFGDTYIHSTEIKKNYGEFAGRVLGQAIAKGAKLVIFENQERLKIIDGDTTYLNLLAEGFIQLYQTLSAQYGPDIKIKILAANRLRMNEPAYEKELIDSEKYKVRVKEKIILGLARRSFTKEMNWDFERASARKDQRLMLADVVCHSWFKKNDRKKFSKIEWTLVEKYYDTNYHFTVFERATDLGINRLLAEGLVGDAIFDIFSSEFKGNQEKFIDVILKKLQSMDDNSRIIQLNNLVNRINSFLLIERQLEKTKLMIEALQSKMVSKMQTANIEGGNFYLDIALFMVTVATHLGDILLTEAQLNVFEDSFKRSKKKWESIGYYFKYRNRLAVHQINNYDFNGCINNMEQLVRVISDTVGLLNLVDDVGGIFEDIKSDEKGKALGTLLQARCYLIRKDSQQIDLAIRNSEEAIAEFNLAADLKRQYQYRCQIESEAGHFDTAIAWLCKSLDSASEDICLDNLLENILAKNKTEFRFSLMHYFRIMAEAALQEQMKLADKMYQALIKLEIDKHDWLSNYETEHPLEIILWKWASFLMLRGSVTAALPKYQEAIRVANSNPKYFTMMSIGLGIAFERAAFLLTSSDKYKKEAEEAIKYALNQYNLFLKQPLTDSMRNYFEVWEPEILKLNGVKTNAEKAKILFVLSRNIPY